MAQASPIVGFRESERFTIQRGKSLGPEQKDDADTAPQRPRLLCAQCRSLIALEPRRVEMSGSHTHTFTNPAGIVFQIGCFADAPGTTSIGGENSAFSWFPGFVWRIALCAACGEHLGWRFRSESSATHFFGLILDKLTEK